MNFTTIDYYDSAMVIIEYQDEFTCRAQIDALPTALIMAVGDRLKTEYPDISRNEFLEYLVEKYNAIEKEMIAEINKLDKAEKQNLKAAIARIDATVTSALGGLEATANTVSSDLYKQVPDNKFSSKVVISGTKTITR